MEDKVFWGVFNILFEKGLFFLDIKRIKIEKCLKYFYTFFLINYEKIKIVFTQNYFSLNFIYP